MDPLAWVVVAGVVLVIGLIIATAGNTTAISIPIRQSVTLYAQDGSVVRNWKIVKNADAAWANSRVTFKDPETNQDVILKGTIVVEQYLAPEKLEPTHTVQLFGAGAEPICTWSATHVDGAWANDRTVFRDCVTGNRVTVFGTTIVLANQKAAPSA